MVRRKKIGQGGAGSASSDLAEAELCTHGLVLRFAMSARLVCSDRTQLQTITEMLSALVDRLVPPESEAAHECYRLWNSFAQLALRCRDDVLVNLGVCFHRDLEHIGQRLDLPPLGDWDETPCFVPDASADAVSSDPSGTATLDCVRIRARDIAAAQQQKVFPPASTLELLNALDHGSRAALFDRLVGQGFMSRAEVNLLMRAMAKGSGLTSEDVALIDVAERLGGWLSQ